MSAISHAQFGPGEDPATADAYCRKCHREEMPPSLLCDRTPRSDNGPEREPGISRYEGLCLRCCDHNHG